MFFPFLFALSLFLAARRFPCSSAAQFCERTSSVYASDRPLQYVTADYRSENSVSFQSVAGPTAYHLHIYTRNPLVTCDDTHIQFCSILQIFTYIINHMLLFFVSHIYNKIRWAKVNLMNIIKMPYIFLNRLIHLSRKTLTKCMKCMIRCARVCVWYDVQSIHLGLLHFTFFWEIRAYILRRVCYAPTQVKTLV